MTAERGTYQRPGQPTKYNKEILDKAYEYLESCIDEPTTEEFVEGPRGGQLIRRHAGKVKFPNAGGLARYLAISRDTVYEWARVHPEFKDVVDAMNAEQEDRLMNGGLSGSYNSTISSLILGRHGYRKEVGISNPDGTMRPMQNMTPEQLEALANAEVAKKVK